MLKFREYVEHIAMFPLNKWWKHFEKVDRQIKKCYQMLSGQPLHPATQTD
jgi:hypothetical protein